MNESQSAQLAAIRERKYAAADIGTAREDIAALLNLLADAERERDEIARDSEVLLGSEWRRSVQAVNGDPEAAREHRIAALVADLAVANERLDHAKMRIREQTAATQEAYANHEADIRRHLAGIVEPPAILTDSTPFVSSMPAVPDGNTSTIVPRS